MVRDRDHAGLVADRRVVAGDELMIGFLPDLPVDIFSAPYLFPGSAWIAFATWWNQF
ncbi:MULTISPECIES: hypothetical protein [unclassified Rhodococcus (in: high G+C Gram-positive bacteria)]|uniref:hypothetical protein n=1 Tax=unclassified Rhodococcus (in: high G+C Gram-positive bacteria) TaxID=192944 RepID=UPI0002DB6D4A|nr:hypothetical protein [Rhodococcus sp. DK17]